MAQHRVCPWWKGYLLASPIRRLWHAPGELVEPHLKAGMTVLEPGPGMGFFTIEMARRVGPDGRVVVVDIQSKMLDVLKRRAADSMGLTGLAGQVDFVLACAVVHELPSPAAFFQEAAQAMKTGASLLLIEPSGHIAKQEFDRELEFAGGAGLAIVERPSIRRSHAALLRKS